MAFQGVLVKKSADQTAVNGNTNVFVTWDSEVYDTDAAHSTVSNTDRITIPSAWNGKYGIFTACVESALVTAGSSAHFGIVKGSTPADFKGMGGNQTNQLGNGQSTTSNWAHAVTGPILLATNDIYSVRLFTGDSSCTIKAHSSFGCYVHANPTQLMQVLCRKANDQTTANYVTPAAVAWDQDIYDTHAIHDISSNNTQLIIPAELNGKYVVAQAQVVASSLAGQNAESLAIRYNGSLTYSGFGGFSGESPDNVISSGVSESRIWVCTQAIQVATGDTFDALYFQDTDTSITIESARSSFGLRVVG